MKINPDKCFLSKREVTYLGFVVPANGSQPPSDRIEGTQAFPQLADSRQLRRFIGLINYYRRCTSLLRHLPQQKKPVSLTWTASSEVAFIACKQTQPALPSCDHKPLIFAAQQPPDKASPRQSRQLDFLLQFPITLAYTKGLDNTVADALSRVNTIIMLANLDLATLALQQSRDPDLSHLLDAPSRVCSLSTSTALRSTARSMTTSSGHTSRASSGRASSRYFTVSRTRASELRCASSPRMTSGLA